MPHISQKSHKRQTLSHIIPQTRTRKNLSNSLRVVGNNASLSPYAEWPPLLPLRVLWLKRSQQVFRILPADLLIASRRPTYHSLRPFGLPRPSYPHIVGRSLDATILPRERVSSQRLCPIHMVPLTKWSANCGLTAAVTM